MEVWSEAKFLILRYFAADQSTLSVTTGSAWSTNHFACHVGYGANAVHPYHAYETVRQWFNNERTQKMFASGKIDEITISEAQENYRAVDQ